MRTTIILLFTALLLVGCNSVKQNQRLLSQGNYDQAIELAIRKLSNDRDSKKSKEHIRLMEQAYKKVVSEDKRRIDFLKKDPSPEKVEQLYNLYVRLERRQQRIRPLLPLGNANFKMVNYTDEIIDAKKDLADYLFQQGNDELNRNTILSARNAFNYFSELKGLQSNYLGLDEKLEEAKFNGTDFVRVSLDNQTGQIIPARLEQELLDFNTYDLDDFWTEYHNQIQTNIDYNFGIRLNFRDIAIAPERISEIEHKRKKKVKDGWEYILDANGNVKKDSLGNDMKRDVYKFVTARVMYTTQTKSVLVGGDVLYRNLETGRDMARHPLSSEFIFENEFAKFRGDDRALTEEDLKFLEFDFLPFPSNEQMVLDAGDDIKLRLKGILRSNALR